ELETLEEFPAELAMEARHILAEALARGEARHFAVKKNRDVIEEIRDAYKRSGGETKRLGLPELTALYEEQLVDVNSMSDFRSTRRSARAACAAMVARRSRGITRGSRHVVTGGA